MAAERTHLSVFFFYGGWQTHLKAHAKLLLHDTIMTADVILVKWNLF